MKTIPILLFSIVLFLGCKGETGPAGPVLKGNLSGNIILMDSLDSRTNNNSGAIVSIEGTTFSATSNTQGAWAINDLPTGTYTINCRKQGYDSHIDLGFQFVGGGTARMDLIYLHPLPNFIINEISVSSSIIDKEIIITGILNSVGYHSIVLFLGRSISVSSAPSTYLYYEYGNTNNTGVGVYNTFTNYIRSDYLSLYGISSGEKIYIKVYPTALGGWMNSYTDPETGNQVFTGLGTGSSRIDSIIIP